MVSGPSGTGKGAICAGLATQKNVALSISMTTRAPRENEVDGQSYYFVDHEHFEREIAENELFEYAEVYGEYYGTPKAPVLEKLAHGMDMILEIEMQGALQVKQSIGDAILIFILPPSMGELRKRIEGRGTEKAADIDFRLSRAASEIEKIVHYDYCVVNDDLDDAISDVAAIMEAERYLTGDLSEKDRQRHREAQKRADELKIGANAQQIIERYRFV